MILIALLATAALGVAAAFRQAAGHEGAGPVGLAGLAACITALLVLYRILQEPGFDEITVVKIGAPLALGVLGVMAFACATALREQPEAGPGAGAAARSRPRARDARAGHRAHGGVHRGGPAPHRRARNAAGEGALDAGDDRDDGALLDVARARAPGRRPRRPSASRSASSTWPAAQEGAACTVTATLREVEDGRKLRFDVEVLRRRAHDRRRNSRAPGDRPLRLRRLTPAYNRGR